jgi:SAM-dependent methyltransferase
MATGIGSRASSLWSPATLISVVKEIQFRSPFRRYFLPRYNFNFTAPQLCFLCQCLAETRDVPGGVAEIGCFAGRTTLFLNNYMDAEGIEKPYTALDTFSGFVGSDVSYEVDSRGKTREMFADFSANKKKWFDATMQDNGVKRVRSVEADVNRFNLSTLAPLSFALLDVDLYRPMRKALPELFGALTPGGIIVVDDCDPHEMKWDGSDQAYKEFMAEIGQTPQVFHGKLGFIKKPAQPAAGPRPV